MIVEAWFGRHREPMKTPAALQAAGLEGRAIQSVYRTGKHIVYDLGPAGRGALDGNAGEPAAQWIVHLGMTGRLLVTTPESPVAPHTHARLTLSSGLELRFVDPRRFGRLEFRELRRQKGFSAPGDDPLRIGETEFAALFRGRKLAIKAALLNQSLLAGVGNIYADESLFRAGIRPRRSAGRLSRAERERLRVALREVLRQAIRLGGSSVSDYVDANGVKGFFQQEHRVYQRTGEPCRECGTTIRRVVVAGRSTHYCPHCQQ
jgi:formamidopyrimidine-DNA glycosylase